MQEGKRQKQISGLLQQELSQVFQRLGLNMIEGAMISISSVKITPDLLEARVYLSIFQSKDVKNVMNKIDDRSWEIKKELVERIKLQLRRIPEIKYFHDDTLDHVFKMEKLFDEIKEKDQTKDEDSNENN
ncbi:MAG: 30S ribosome-binding factor RbfA [Chitinophagaceae bacterium]|jgi:ribosome-binding factor A|nr:30S ribosome-binding factor RbfA [Chitinophagaceae bacterium]